MHLFYAKLSVKKLQFMANCQAKKNHFGMVIEAYCSGKTSAIKMNKKKNRSMV